MRLEGKQWILSVALLLFPLLFPPSGEAQVRIRLATLLPQGSSQYHALEEMGQQWKASTGGAVTLTIYPGGTMGGEEETIRRLRLGQLQAATLSAAGLSSIDSAVGAIEKIPLLYHSLDEMEYVCSKMQPDLEQRLEQKGFVALAWTDAGWIHIISRQPYTTPEEFKAKKSKIFVTASDIDEAGLMNSLGFQAVPLEWSDVLIGLQTGLVDTVPVTPFYALASQFDLAAKNLLEVKYVPLVGATVMTKRAWDALTPEQREKVLKAATEAGKKIRAQSRAESQEAVEAMKKRGLQVRPVPQDLEDDWRRFAESVYPKMRGKMIPADAFDKTLSFVAEYRESQRAGRP
ncbi:MAG TPA: TRAP transporter substrate-binding protein DctP [Candidatus Acidoferrum sp.]|nr:TRAP transporter substrate-binding protein DctP [Candidatus Acidoferrum sp.]